MAATTAGAFKAYLETLGLGVPFYRDGAPKSTTAGALGTSFPYGVIQEAIGVTPELHGDFGDPDADDAVTELVQVDLYQRARELDGPGHTKVLEVYGLPGSITRALRGVGVQPFAPTLVYGHSVDTLVRWPVSDNVVRHTWTVRVRRSERLREVPA